jgi:hypothetical protein
MTTCLAREQNLFLVLIDIKKTKIDKQFLKMTGLAKGHTILFCDFFIYKLSFQFLMAFAGLGLRSNQKRDFLVRSKP